MVINNVNGLDDDAISVPLGRKLKVDATAYAYNLDWGYKRTEPLRHVTFYLKKLIPHGITPQEETVLQQTVLTNLLGKVSIIIDISHQPAGSYILTAQNIQVQVVVGVIQLILERLL